RLIRNEILTLDCDERLFKTVVKTAFNQRRKTLRNSLKPLVEKGNLMYDDPFFDKRPEQLDVQDFVRLTNMIESSQKNQS
ncbi:16S rRNA (adenine(1518)-N(6)/adenine(1519)-N(6))-dimethyltransferase, partial [Paludibacteraceae bacterium OttesenSCG-928-F17]|nr:16S rRNA (adenine(1518)-N(6)/adenine(1519)-N(6))-dimethyltransferase [Paludibacteraceae bacterium OttesenSCG-928-F17]